jgi:thiosulfate reductase cytochrome b subunit
MTASSRDADDSADHRLGGHFVYKQTLGTRIAHWIWAIALFFLLLSGLQIFNAHPTLYLGKQSGFGFDNAILSMSGETSRQGSKGTTTVLGRDFDTTGWLGMSHVDGKPTERGFPAWATIPATQDLATGRIVHFFFAWILVAALLVWWVSSLVNGHAWRDVTPGRQDFRRLPQDVIDHLKLRFHGGRSYNTLQKLSYAGVLFVLLPLMIVTGLLMSPGMNAFAPSLVTIVGRQTARTVHFFGMATLVLFFIVHIAMVVAAGPFNELRSMITGWFRTSKSETGARESTHEV